MANVVLGGETPPLRQTIGVYLCSSVVPTPLPLPVPLPLPDNRSTRTVAQRGAGGAQDGQARRPAPTGNTLNYMANVVLGGETPPLRQTIGVYLCSSVVPTPLPLPVPLPLPDNRSTRTVAQQGAGGARPYSGY